QGGLGGDEVGAGAVDLGQPLEVARVGAEARGERGGEAVRVGCAQQRVAGLLPADGAGAGGAGWGGAERSGAVGGPHRGGVGEGGEAVQGGVLGAGEFLGPVVAEQVGPGGRADDQRPAGEHPDRSAAVAEQERQVLVGVPGGGQGVQGQSVEVDLVAVAQCPVVEGAPAGGGGEDGRVVVGGEQRPQVAWRVHREGPPVAQVQQVGGRRI